MKTFAETQHEQAGMDAERLHEMTGDAYAFMAALKFRADFDANTDTARNALREAADQIKDTVLPVLAVAIDELEEQYRVSREGATDYEPLVTGGKR